MKIEVYKSPVARFGWFWKVSENYWQTSDYCFTKRGAVRAAKKYARSLTKTYERFEIELD